MRTPAQALEALRALPCGADALGAYGPDDGVLRGGRSGPRHAAGAHAARARPRRHRRPRCRASPAWRPRATDVRVHERFGSATVTLADGCRLDLVRARAERYERPGALPEVRPGTLEEDLRRRDVTVNAMALGLDGEPARRRRSARRPRGRAACGCCTTRASATTRPGSGASPATPRAWGSRSTSTPRELAAAADPSTVSGDRLGAELRLALTEPDPFAALRAAQELNPRLLPPGFAVREAEARAALELLPPEGRADLVVLAACTAGMDLPALLSWLDDLGFTAAERDLVAAASRAVTAAPLRGRAHERRDRPRRPRRAGGGGRARRRRGRAALAGRTCATCAWRSPAPTCWPPASRRARSSASACAARWRPSSRAARRTATAELRAALDEDYPRTRAG